MIQYFGVGEMRRNEFRALQAWLILIGLAANRQTATYGGIAERMGYPQGRGAGVLGPILGHIMCYCQENELPPLTILVVNKGTGKPGPGLSGVEDLDVQREQVFNFPWHTLVPPTPLELHEAYHQ